MPRGTSSGVTKTYASSRLSVARRTSSKEDRASPDWLLLGLVTPSKSNRGTRVGPTYQRMPMLHQYPPKNVGFFLLNDVARRDRSARKAAPLGADLVAILSFGTGLPEEGVRGGFRHFVVKAKFWWALWSHGDVKITSLLGIVWEKIRFCFKNVLFLYY